MSRYGVLGFKSLLGLFLILFSLLCLALPDAWNFGNLFSIDGGSWWSVFWGWQVLYILLGVGMALLVDVRADRTLYLFVFIILLIIYIIGNWNFVTSLFGWITVLWQRVSGLLCMLLGYFFILCARYYTVKIMVKRH